VIIVLLILTSMHIIALHSHVVLEALNRFFGTRKGGWYA
jgi:hypothetical protein